VKSIEKSLRRAKQRSKSEKRNEHLDLYLFEGKMLFPCLSKDLHLQKKKERRVGL